MNPLLLWSAFFFCASIIMYCGTKLSVYGDIISEKTGLGSAWIGAVLVAFATSLPELVTGVSSVTFASAPDIAVGDIMGSCVLNLLLLALIDVIHKGPAVSSIANTSNVLTGGFGIILFSTFTFSMIYGKAVPQIGWIGLYSIVFIAIFLASLRLLLSYTRRNVVSSPAASARHKDVSVKKAFTLFGLNALIVALAASFLPGIGKTMAEMTGLGQSFIGNVLVAMTTSLPELVVTISAVRIGSIDIAVGNVLGSNVFNMVILSIDDLFFTDGPLLEHVSNTNIFSALSATIMTSIMLIGLIIRSEKKYLGFGADTLFVTLIFILNVALLYSG